MKSKPYSFRFDLLLVWLLCIGTAWAQPAGGGMSRADPDRVAKVQNLLDTGFQREQANDLSGAIEAYESAQALMAHEEVAERMAQLRVRLEAQNREKAQHLIHDGYALEKKGHLRAALTQYKSAYRLVQDAGIYERILAVEKRLHFEQAKPGIKLEGLPSQVVFGQSIDLSAVLREVPREYNVRVIWHASPTGNRFAHAHTFSAGRKPETKPQTATFSESGPASSDIHSVSTHVTPPPPRENFGNTLMVGQMGTVHISASLQVEDTSGEWETVAETETVKLEVGAPDFEWRFDPARNAGVGEALRIQIRSQPTVPRDMLAFEWRQPETVQNLSADGSDVQVVLDAKDLDRQGFLPLSVRVLDPNSGLTIADLEKRYATEAAAPGITLEGIPPQVFFGQSMELTPVISGVPEGEAVRVVWSASPEGNRFERKHTDGTANRLIVGRMGTVRVSATLQRKQGLIWKDVATTEEQEIQVRPPRVTAEFTPSKGAQIGERLRVTLNTDPPIPEGLLEVRWQSPVDPKRLERDGTEIQMVVGEGSDNLREPIPLEAELVVKEFGDRIGELKGAYSPGPVELRIEEPERQGGRGKIRDPVRGEIVDAPEGEGILVTDQKAKIRVTLEPKPKSKVEMEWSVTPEDGSLKGWSDTRKTFSARSPGDYVVTVVARTAGGQGLDRDEYTISVLASAEYSKQEEKRKGKGDKDKDKKEKPSETSNSGQWVLIDVKEHREEAGWGNPNILHKQGFTRDKYYPWDYSGGLDFTGDGAAEGRFNWHGVSGVVVGQDEKGRDIYEIIPASLSFSASYRWTPPPPTLKSIEDWDAEVQLQIMKVNDYGAIPLKDSDLDLWIPSSAIPAGDRWDKLPTVNKYQNSPDSKKILGGDLWITTMIHSYDEVHSSLDKLLAGTGYKASVAGYTIKPAPGGLKVSGKGFDIAEPEYLNEVLVETGTPGRKIYISTTIVFRNYENNNFRSGDRGWYGVRYKRTRTYEFQGEPLELSGKAGRGESGGPVAALLAILAFYGGILGATTPGQAAAGMLGPAAMVMLLQALGKRFAAASMNGLVGFPPGTEHVFEDGRTYREGEIYTFDDGGVYKLINGNFERVRSLRDGEIYTNPDGDSRVFKGGQSHDPSTLARQEALNAASLAAHRQDAAEHLAEREREIEAERRQREAEDELFERLQGWRRTAQRQGMTEGVDDTAGRMTRQIERMIQGDAVEADQLMRIRDHVMGRITGRTKGPGDLPPPEVPFYLDWDSMAKAAGETARELSTGQSADGSTSWWGILWRTTLGAGTAGASEWAFIPTSSMYTVKNAIDAGDSGFTATMKGMGGALFEDMIGRGIGAGFRAGGAVLDGVVEGGWKGGLWAGLGSLDESAAGFLGEMAEGLGKARQGISRVGTLLKTPPPTALASSAPGSPASPLSLPNLSPDEISHVDMFRRAVKSGDPDQVATLYQNRGMRELDRLQRLGVISPEDAMQANRLITEKANTVIRRATREAIEEHNISGVRIREVIVADSGPSAKGGVIRLNTDADRTLIVNFDDAQLHQYAARNKLTPTQAYEELSGQFQIKQHETVQRLLEPEGLTACDFEYNAYNGIGSSSGHCDSYPPGYTNARQTTGTGEVYRLGKDGCTVNSPYAVSGQTVVDADQVVKFRYQDQPLSLDPVRFTPDEVRSVVTMQVRSIANHAKDAHKVAKAVLRAHKAGRVGGIPLKGSADLLEAANTIYRDPGTLEHALREHGFGSIEEFCNQGVESVNDLLRSYNP